MSKSLLILWVLVILIAGCAAGPNITVHIPGPDGKIAGFWLGLWHGIIAPVTLVISFFKDSVSVYEVHNNGGWYNFGFVLGACVLLSNLLRRLVPRNLLYELCYLSDVLTLRQIPKPKQPL